MAIQQMGLMAYKAPPAGGGDSAFLKQGFFTGGNVSIISVSITFNEGGGINQGKVTYTNDLSETYTWKTGPNAFTAYEAMFVRTAQSGPNDITGTVNAFATMADNLPSWTLDASDPTSSVTGYLVIRNASNPGVELANVEIQLSANPNV